MEDFLPFHDLGPLMPVRVLSVEDNANDTSRFCLKGFHSIYFLWLLKKKESRFFIVVLSTLPLSGPLWAATPLVSENDTQLLCLCCGF